MHDMREKYVMGTDSLDVYHNPEAGVWFLLFTLHLPVNTACCP